MQIAQKADDKEQEVAEGETSVEYVVPMTLDELDSEPGFYQYAIRPMLNPGHEGELCEWLKEMGLLPRSMRCINADSNSRCNVPMQWTHARIVDKYQWQCAECHYKRSIRDDSFFKQIKCSLDTVLRLILGWCKGINGDTMTEVINTKSFIVKKVFESCSRIAATYISTYSLKWQLGGEGDVVLIDVFPTHRGVHCANNNSKRNNNLSPVLCIAEIKAIPTRFWFQALNSSGYYAKQYDEKVIISCIDAIRAVVKPGSVVVVEPRTVPCPRNLLSSLKCYPVVIETGQLRAYDTPHLRTLHENLETIWAPAVDICEAAQDYPRNQIQSYLNNMLWRHLYARTPSTALENILHNIADCWVKPM